MRNLQYDKATFVILNYALTSFGLRLKSDQQLVFTMRSVDYMSDKQCKTNTIWAEIIPIQTELSKVFEFLELNYDAFEVGFSTIFEYSDFLNSSPYITPSFLRILDKQLSKPDLIVDEEIRSILKRVITHIKLGPPPPNELSKKIQALPLLLHKNLKEKIVRKYFQDESFEDKLREIKRRRLTYLAKGKITKSKLLEWFPLLNVYPELHDMFMLPFINYMTENNPSKFPGYLADSEVTEIRRDMRDFYNDIFINSPEVVKILYDNNEIDA